MNARACSPEKALLRKAAALTAFFFLFGCSDAPRSAAVKASGTPAPPVVGRWSMYQGSPDHNAVLPGRSLYFKWKSDIGERTNGGLALAGNRIFLDTFGKKALAIDATTGKLLWSVPLGNVAMSTPVVAEGHVFIGTGKNERGFTFWGRKQGDDILALDGATGNLIWKFHTVGEDMPSPAYTNGTIVFANGDAHAYGLHAGSGTLAWKTALPGIATMASATAVGNDVYLSVCSDKFARAATLKLDARDGRILWKAPFGNCDSSPAYAQGRVFVSGIEGLTQDSGFGGRGIAAALDAKSGKPLWVYRSPAIGRDTMVGSAERAIAGTYADGLYIQAIPGEDSVVALDALTGRLRWRVQTLAPVKMSAIASAGRAYFGDIAGVFYAADMQNGRVWHTQLMRDGFSTTPPVMWGRTMLLANGRTLYAGPAIR